MSAPLARIALGTAQFGLDYGVTNASGQVAAATVQALLAQAAEAGLGYLDTASAYGNAEAVLGRALPQLQGQLNAQIITKLPPDIAQAVNPAAAVRAAVAQSLAHLGQTRLYAVLTHRGSDFTGSVVATLTELQQEGVIEHVGASIYAPDELPALLQTQRLQMVQAPFNLLDQRLLRSGWLARLADAGVRVHARSALLQGLLVAEHATLPEHFAASAALLQHFWADCAAQQLSPFAAAVQFCYQQPLIEAVVVGVTQTRELTELIQATANPISLAAPERYATTDLTLINPAVWPKGLKLAPALATPTPAQAKAA